MKEHQALLREVLDATPTSLRALADAASVSEKLLRMIRDGDRRLTPEVRAALAEAIRTWEKDCGDAVDALEAADLEPGGEDA